MDYLFNRKFSSYFSIFSRKNILHREKCSQSRILYPEKFPLNEVSFPKEKCVKNVASFLLYNAFSLQINEPKVTSYL